MIALFLSLLSLVSAREIALYFGQADSKPLIDYCADDSADIFILSFLSQFGAGRENKLEIGDASGYYGGTIADGAGNPFLNDLSGQIQWCQGKGKKVLLSLGGGYSKDGYGFSSAGDASGFASYLWDAFLGGSGVSRPFNTAKLDGLDLDIESTYGDNTAYYVEFVNKLRDLYSTDSSNSTTLVLLLSLLCIMTIFFVMLSIILGLTICSFSATTSRPISTWERMLLSKAGNPTPTNLRIGRIPMLSFLLACLVIQQQPMMATCPFIRSRVTLVAGS